MLRLRVHRLPSKRIIPCNPQLFSRFIDQFTQFIRSINNSLVFISVFFLNYLSNLRIFPRSSEVKFASAFKLLLSFNFRVENPLSLFKENVGFEGFEPLIESFDFFSRKLSVQNLKFFTKSQSLYIREPRFPTKRLLLSNNLLAIYSFAPYLLEHVI